MFAFSLTTLLDSGVVRGLGLCAAIAIIVAVIRAVFDKRAEVRHLRILADIAQDRARMWAEEASSARTQLYAARDRLQRAEQSLEAYRRVPAQRSGDVPGLLEAMRRAVQTKEAGEQVLVVGTVGDPKYVDLAASVVIHDYRPLPNEDREEGDERPDPTALQGEGARYFAVPHAMTAGEVSQRVQDFATRQNAITAAIQREALETAAAALDPAKRAMLWAEGGEAAVYAYVAPAVKDALAELEAQTKLMTAAMLHPPVAWLSSPFDAALRDGLDHTWKSFKPPEAPTAE